MAQPSVGGFGLPSVTIQVLPFSWRICGNEGCGTRRAVGKGAGGREGLSGRREPACCGAGLHGSRRGTQRGAITGGAGGVIGRGGRRSENEKRPGATVPTTWSRS